MRVKMILIVAGILVLLILPIYGISVLMRVRNYAIIPHGYDGVVASTLNVEHDYERNYVNGFNTGLAMGIDPYGRYVDCTGLRISITSPQYDESNDRENFLGWEKFIDTSGNVWNRTTTQKVSKMTFEMSMNLETYGQGIGPISDVTFWIELKNNDFSVFSGATDTAIAVINVYNKERPYVAQAGRGVQFEPEARGADYPLTTLGGDNVPGFDGLENEYNVPAMKALSNVKFPLYVINAQPTTELELFPLGDRVEVQVEFLVGIDILVVGEFVELKPYRGVEWQPPQLTWWQILVASVGSIFSTIILIALILVGIAGSGIALVKGGKSGPVVVLVIWAGIVFLLWFLGVF